MTLRRALTIAPVAWAAGVALFFLFAPVYGTVTDSVHVARDPHGGPNIVTRSSTRGHQSGLEGSGPSMILSLSIPILLALAPILVRAQPRTVRLTAGALLLVYCVLGALSVGLFFLPSALLLLISAVRF
jgi:hypothetical protein